MDRIANRNPKHRRCPVTRLAYGAWVAGLLVAVVSCGGGGGDGNVVTPAVTASFSPSGTASGANLVRLQGSASGDLVTIDVVIKGPTTTDDVYSFAFDLELSNPAVARYENGSALFGAALTIGAGQSSQILASQNGDRVTLGVSKAGGGDGNGVGDAEVVVAKLTFRVLSEGLTLVTISGSPPNDPAALDSTGATIDSIQFDPAPAAISGT